MCVCTRYSRKRKQTLKTAVYFIISTHTRVPHARLETPELASVILSHEFTLLLHVQNPTARQYYFTSLGLFTVSYEKNEGVVLQCALFLSVGF